MCCFLNRLVSNKFENVASCWDRKRKLSPRRVESSSCGRSNTSRHGTRPNPTASGERTNVLFEVQKFIRDSSVDSSVPASPGFKFQAHHLCFNLFIFELYHLEKTKINIKEAHLKTFATMTASLYCHWFLQRNDQFKVDNFSHLNRSKWFLLIWLKTLPSRVIMSPIFVFQCSAFRSRRLQSEGKCTQH